MSKVFDEATQAIRMAFDKMREIAGEDYKLEEGDAFACEGKNFCLIIGLDNGKLRTEFIGGKALKLDMAMSLYEDMLYMDKTEQAEAIDEAYSQVMKENAELKKQLTAVSHTEVEHEETDT